jgi:hypothetical protein
VKTSTDQKYRLTEDEIAMLNEAILVSARHYSRLSAEAHILGDPIYGEMLEEKSKDFLRLAGQAQYVTRVTVRVSA